MYSYFIKLKNKTQREHKKAYIPIDQMKISTHLEQVLVNLWSHDIFWRESIAVIAIGGQKSVSGD